ncbi:MAG: ATP-binding cassette domain-containing protein [Gammaproteobacteria bacterium]|nr:ATP-binding cassette domain-containing protein [Gammaproteobacteria bacterium]MBU2057186.1 ATP-binding cassette domain-containing protein [Gammaproteobacteria bacterium]MBU2174963.1 ATP-binding cassette domain-containing protein [Gammaproteobacteria bacterium]MBU2246274.1 ATP-binding cassette domain-containing protein [Gammaproteobacteria bacterium]MBU2346157.1 ATP-binding cassette domain-containing protein [Gammaproteobacteria bacterium]
MLTINNLSFGYGKQQLFSNLKLQLDAGLHWLSGVNGSGKSSLLRVLAGLDKASQGSISFHQHQVGSSAYQTLVSISADAVAPLQDNTVLGVLQLVARCRGTAMEQLLLHAKAFALEPLLKQKVAVLSLGQQKKLSLTLALAANPQLVLLDEPFNALDPDSLIYCCSVLQAAKERGALVLIASHLSPQSFELAVDQHLELKAGGHLSFSSL